MPQPLSTFKGEYGYNIASTNSIPSGHNPALVAAAMKVIANFSILEYSMMSIFVEMLGTNPKPAIATYASIRSEAAKRDAIRAVGTVVLSPEEMDMLEGIFDLMVPPSKDRNKIAHWVWGMSPQMPDAILLMNPERGVLHKAELDEATLEDRFKESGIPLDDTYIWKMDDFVEASGRIDRVRELASYFYFLVIRDHPVNRDGKQFARLSAEPEIRTFLDRLSERRKRLQEDQQRQREKSAQKKTSPEGGDQRS